jgi:ATP-dependent helicase Lhr and Lhr-like helicase
MTTLPVSGSEPHSAADTDRPRSEAFERLHPDVRRWIWQRGWRELRDAQEAAITPILAGDVDVLISAATASGKTEAAFLPICSVLTGIPAAGPGIGVVYVSPLKALINDQWSRLEELCELLEIPVHRWHGDVAGARKQRVLNDPRGVLLITPESLEALFALRGTKIRGLFGTLRYVVIDELHSFIGTERGAQLQSLLHRLELAVRRRVPRVGLSATLGDMADAAEYLRPRHGAQVSLITSTADTQELRLQLRGYVHADPGPTPPDATGREDAVTDADAAIAQHLFDHLRGTDNLVFAGSRSKVEKLTDRLTRRSEQARVPNEFVPHHGNLSKEIREHVEARLKDRSLPVTAICTSTLEMGIDIGTVTSVAQIGAPPSVAALRQRLGRSGRRGEPAMLRIYVREPEITADTSPQDQLRAQLVQTIATVDLLLDRWYEPPSTSGLHLSTLTQQILSLIAQHGGATPREAYRTLCGQGPFHHIDQETFRALLRAHGSADLLRQGADGVLLHGEKGEQLVNHYSFFAAFASPAEYRLVAEGRTLGSIAPSSPLIPGGLLIFAGQRWKIRKVDTSAKLIELTPSTGGRPPEFTGGGPDVHDRIRAHMRMTYQRTEIPIYLDPLAQRLLGEARDNYRRFGLAENPIVGWGDDTLVFPFRGDTVMSALALAIQRHGIDCEQNGLALQLADTNPEQAADVLRHLAATPPPEPRTLAALVPEKELDKYDELLDDELLTTAYAARKLDVAGAWASLAELLSPARQASARLPRTESPRPPTRHRISELPYAVIDTETTGLDPARDRIIEIAVIRLNPDGTLRRTFSTILQSDQGPGPTHVHHLTDADLAGAPRFADIAGDLVRIIDGAVIVAHNAMFDTAMLTAEFARAGALPDDLLSLCTLQLAQRYGPSLRSLRLSDCLQAESIQLHDAHTALADAEAAAQLLVRYLARARQDGADWLDEIGATGALPRPSWAPWPATGRHRTRPATRTRLTTPPLPVPAQATPSATLYADLIARAAATPKRLREQFASLRAMADRLNLDRDARQAVQAALAQAWTQHPRAAGELSAMDDL